MVFGLTEGVKNKINNVFQINQDIKEVFIYGSRAKGNYRDGSDIDLCIKKSDISMSDLLGIKVQLDELLLPYEIDLCDYNKLTNQKLKEHIDRVGIVFWQRESYRVHGC